MYSTQFIDNLYQSQNCTPVELPGTTTLSRRPSQFIPALLAAVLTPALLTALTAAWNTLAAKLSGAAPIPASVPGITAAMVTEAGNVDAVQSQVGFALATFNASPPVVLLSNTAQLCGDVQGLQSQLTVSNFGARFAPLTVTDLKELSVGLPSMASQLSAMFGEYLTLQTAIVGGGALPPSTIVELFDSAGFREIEVNSVLAVVNNLNKGVWGAGAATDLVAAGIESITSQATVNAILGWINANAGGAAVSITGTGAPFGNLEAWRLAQGI